MDYTIDNNVITRAKNDYKYLNNLLFIFIHENPHKVVVNTEILDDYGMLSEDCEKLRVWISLMDHSHNWKQINYKSSNDNLYLNVCKETYDKILIVDEKEDFSEELLDNITPLNKDEAIEFLKEPSTTIFQSGVGNQLSTGKNSPNS